jgi:hypothetical protein
MKEAQALAVTWAFQLMLCLCQKAGAPLLATEAVYGNYSSVNKLYVPLIRTSRVVALYRLV